MSFTSKQFALLSLSAPLTQSTKIVLLFLADLASEEHFVTASVPQIAEGTRASRSTVMEALKTLIEQKWIKTVDQPHIGPYAHSYYINVPNAFNPRANTHRTKKPLTRDPRSNIPGWSLR